MNTQPLPPSELITDLTGHIAWPTIMLFVTIVLGYTLVGFAAFYELVELIWLTPLCCLLSYSSFTVVHDAGHGNIVGGNHQLKWLERTLGWVASFTFVFLPFSLFAKLHDYHHAFTNEYDQDPDFWIRGNSIGIIILKAVTVPFHYLYIAATRLRKHSAINNTFVTSSIYWLLMLSIVTGSIALGAFDYVFYLLILPVLPSAILLGILFDWLPHTPSKTLQPLYNTRIIFFPFANVITFGQSYHLVHHLFPRIPWYQYKQGYHRIKPLLKEHNATIEYALYKTPSPEISAYATPFKNPKHQHQLQAPNTPFKLGLQVEKIDKLTHKSVLITFEPLEQKLPFNAGQYVVISHLFNNQHLSRCYSICSAPSASQLQIAVKQTTNGVMSSYLTKQLRCGDYLTLSGAFGDFTYQPSQTLPVLLIAAGSGITPMMSIIKTALSSNSTNKITLIYCNKSIADCMFYQTLTTLAAQNSVRLSIVWCWSNPQAVEAYGTTKARLDETLLTEIMQLLPMQQLTYICGPELLTAWVQPTLVKLGILPQNIACELFNTPVKKTSEAENEKTYQVEVIDHGTCKQFNATSSQTLLNAALAQNIDLPYACKDGKCGTCKATKLNGKVSYHNPSAILTEQEIARGVILTCQCYTHSNITIEIN